MFTTCPYCGSNAITINPNNEYVCASCGTVLGPVYYPPLYNTIHNTTPIFKPRVWMLITATQHNTKKTYSELIKAYIAEGANKLGRPEIIDTVMKLYEENKKTIIGTRPKIAAAALLYLALRDDPAVSKPRIAEVLGVSKYTLRDVVSRLSHKDDVKPRHHNPTKNTVKITRKDLQYIVEIVYYLSHLRQKGAVSIRTWKLCKTKRCVLRTRKILIYLMQMGLARKIKEGKGLYIIRREDVGKAIEALRALAFSV